MGKGKAKAMETCGQQGVGDPSREERDCLKEESLLGGDSVEKSLEFYFSPLANLTANCGDRREGQALASLLATLSRGSGETGLGIWKSAQWGFIRVPGAGRGGTSSL